jgi:hypothetical protein
LISLLIAAFHTTNTYSFPSFVNARHFLGFAAEFDSPKKLIENKTSLFALLVAEYWAQAGRNSAKD